MTDILRLSIPLTAWLAMFSAIYGLQGLVCSARWRGAGLDLDSGRWALALAGLLGIAIQSTLLLALRSPRFASSSGFMQSVSLTLATVALVATAWTLLPIATTAACR